MLNFCCGSSSTASRNSIVSGAKSDVNNLLHPSANMDEGTTGACGGSERETERPQFPAHDAAMLCAGNGTSGTHLDKIMADSVPCQKQDKRTKKKGKFWTLGRTFRRKSSNHEVALTGKVKNKSGENDQTISGTSTQEENSTNSTDNLTSGQATASTNLPALLSHMSMGAGPSHPVGRSLLSQVVPPPHAQADTHVSCNFPFEAADGHANRAAISADVISRGPINSAYPHLRYPSSNSTLFAISSSPMQTAVRPCQAPSVVNNGLSTFGRSGSPPLPSTLNSCVLRTEYTQIDYIHFLVPDLLEISRCGYYWGVMDRYEAEKLLEAKPEGTFLLRDSAQEDFLFSVSFRRYGRSLHARIDQWNHRFSFDTHDPGVFSANSVTALIEHYKDPSCCMFFEPLLTIALNRNFPFSLQHLCRSVICNNVTYDSINLLPLPKQLIEYLKYYNYKLKVRVRRMEALAPD